MEWHAEATVLNARPHGETSAIVEVLTESHGRFAGLVRGGVGRRLRPVLQTGNRVQANWRARLSDHLGTLTVEPVRGRAGAALQDPLHLAALTALCDMVRIFPERQPYPRLVQAFETLIDCLDNSDVWPAVYVRFELAMLDELGFGLDLSSCAATGNNDNLTHISPRSGRAVSASAAEPYLDKLFALPPFFLNAGAEVTASDILAGFEVTGFFLGKRLYASVDDTIPVSRSRMLSLLARDRA
ncbi:MAG: DNA repair protein RecO [Parvibaculales bacterium]